MNKTKRLLIFFLGVQFLTCAQPAFSAENVSTLPRFFPLTEVRDQFDDPRDMSFTLCVYFRRGPSLSGHSLEMDGLVRDFALGKPYSPYPDEPLMSARAIASAAQYADDNGLFESAPMIAKKAVALSAMPLVVLENYGILYLADAAAYYAKTGRSDVSEKIYSNLTSKPWLSVAPKYLRATVLFCYADYLKARGKEEESTIARSEAESLRAGITAENEVVMRPDPKLVRYVDADATASRAIYEIICAGQDKRADDLIETFIAGENAKSEHADPAISRLINIARVLSQSGRHQKAAALLEQVLELTGSDSEANTHLFVCALLYALPGNSPSQRDKYWAKIDADVRRIDDMVCLLTMLPAGSAEERGQRLYRYLDLLALNLSYTGCDRAAYELSTRAAIDYSAAGFTRNWADLHRAYFAAQAKSYDEIVSDISAAVKNLDSLRYSDAILGRIEQVCTLQGRPDVAEAVAKKVIDIGDKKVADMPDSYFGNSKSTPARIAEARQNARGVECDLSFFRLGQALNQEGRFADAEAALKQSHPSNSSYLISHLSVLPIELACSLEGQHKYAQAIDVYQSIQPTNTTGCLPVFAAILNLVEKDTAMSTEQQEQILAIVTNHFRYRGERNVLDELQKLEQAARNTHWQMSNIEGLTNLVDQSRKAAGRDLAVSR